MQLLLIIVRLARQAAPLHELLIHPLVIAFRPSMLPAKRLPAPALPKDRGKDLAQIWPIVTNLSDCFGVALQPDHLRHPITIRHWHFLMTSKVMELSSRISASRKSPKVFPQSGEEYGGICHDQLQPRHDEVRAMAAVHFRAIS